MAGETCQPLTLFTQTTLKTLLMKHLMLLVFTTLLLAFGQASLNAQWLHQGCADFSASSQGIHFYNEDVGAIVGFNSAISYTTDGGQTWVQNYDHELGNFYDLWMTDAESAFVVGSEGLFKTDDLFETLTPIDLGPELFGLNDIDASFGDFVVCGGGTIYYSADNGITWSENIAPQGFEELIYYRCHAGSAGIVAAGVSAYLGIEDYLLIQSPDLFETVNLIDLELPFQATLPPDGPNSAIYSMDFINEGVGYAVVTSDWGQYLIRTENAGLNWMLANDEAFDLDIKDIAFTSFDQGHIAARIGEQGLAAIYETTDGGVNLSSSPTIIPDGATAGDDISLHFIDESTGYAVAAGTGDIIDVPCSSVVKYTTEQCSNILNLTATLNQSTTFCLTDCMMEGVSSVNVMPLWGNPPNLTEEPTGCFEYTPQTTGLNSFQMNLNPDGEIVNVNIQVSAQTGNISVQANDDYYNFPQIFPSTTLHILDNDFGESPQISILQQPTIGTVEVEGNVVVYYAGSESDTAPDFFVYQITDINGDTDEATVYINWIVNDPQIVNFTMESNQTLNFSTMDMLGDEEGIIELGTASNGIASLNNMEITYIPNSNFTGTDSFLATVCDIMFGGCRYIQFVITVGDPSILCDPDMPEQCVWPGDSNNDGIANNMDVLNIGLTMNTTGLARNLQSIEWDGYYSVDWIANLADGLNFKYSDCDGDGTINTPDLQAVSQNYGLTHAKTGDQEEATETDPELRLDLPEGADFSKGNTISLNIDLGTEDLLAEDVYGLAFTINYDPIMVEAGSVELDLSESWLGEESDLIQLVKEFPNEGEGFIDLAISRTNQIANSGYGTLGVLTFVTDDIIAGKTLEEIVFSMDISNIRAINAEGDEITLQSEGDSVTATIAHIESTQYELELFPNPSRDWLNISTSLQIQSLQLRDITGRLVKQAAADTNQIFLGDLALGMYFISIETREGQIQRKVLVR